MKPDNDVEYIDSATALEAFRAEASVNPWLAMDTEFVREKTYYPSPGLIQAALPNRIACIDPVTIKDLTPLFELLRDTRVVKIFHAAGQDLELIHQMSGHGVQPLFDTQIAAQMTGMGEQISYAALVESFTGISLPKSHTRTNWRKRPLSREQIRYAADDVRYLGPIYEKLSRQLEQAGRLDWLYEDTQRLVGKQSTAIDGDQLLLRLKGQHELTGKARAIARELATWREETARQRNLPKRWVLADETIFEWATNGDPDAIAARIRNPDKKNALISRNREAILRAIQRGANLPTEEWPAPPAARRPDPAVTARLKTLRKIINDLAARENIAAGLLANRRDLEKLLEGHREIPLMQGWRYQLAGAAVERFLDAGDAS